MTNPILELLRADDPHYEVYPLAEPIRELVRDYIKTLEALEQCQLPGASAVWDIRSDALSTSAKHLELLNAVKEGV